MSVDYRVVSVNDRVLELWDGQSRIEPGHPTPALMTVTVQEGSRFEVGDIVDLVVVLRERPQRPEGP